VWWQHQRIDEEADEIVERTVGAARIGLPMANVGAAPSRVSSAARRLQQP